MQQAPDIVARNLRGARQIVNLVDRSSSPQAAFPGNARGSGGQPLPVAHPHEADRQQQRSHIHRSHFPHAGITPASQSNMRWS